MIGRPSSGLSLGTFLVGVLLGCGPGGDKADRAGDSGEWATPPTVPSTPVDTASPTVTATTTATTPPTTPPCDPQPCVVEGVLTDDFTLTSNASWLMRGTVKIGQEGAPVTLTVEPGTVVYGERASEGRLVVTRGSSLVADGREDAPIVFTSDQAEGMRAAGDWGGLTILGAASTNRCALDEVPAGDPCEVVTDDGIYGGGDDADGSSVLRYVQVAFAGLELRAVGSGVAIDRIQVHRSATDGVNLIGGAAQLRRVLVTQPADDGLDWEGGWIGRAQFVAVQQSPEGATPSVFRERQAIEGENLLGVNAALPVSDPVLANVTLAGASAETRCVHLSEGTRMTLIGLVAVGCGAGGLDVDHDVTLAHALDGSLGIQSSTLDGLEPFVVDPIQSVLGFDVEAWFLGQEGNAVEAVVLEAPDDLGAPDLRSVGDAGAITLPDDPFFEPASERGAMPGGVDWSVGWSSTPES